MCPHFRVSWLRGVHCIELIKVTGKRLANCGAYVGGLCGLQLSLLSRNYFSCQTLNRGYQIETHSVDHNNYCAYKEGSEYKKYWNSYFGLTLVTKTWSWPRFNRTLREKNHYNKLGCLPDCGKTHSITRTAVVLAVETSISSCPVAIGPNFDVKNGTKCILFRCAYSTTSFKQTL